MIAPYNCVVVANGRFPQTALPLHLLHQASVVIACDGAVEALDKAGITPTAIVGDLDSIPSRFREQYADRIHIVEDQEINDLTKSVRFAHRSGQQEVLILGATGLREDHTLGNISLLMDIAIGECCDKSAFLQGGSNGRKDSQHTDHTVICRVQ